MIDNLYAFSLVYDAIGASVLMIYYWRVKPKVLSVDAGMCLFFFVLIFASSFDIVVVRTLLGPWLITILIIKHWSEIKRMMNFSESRTARVVKKVARGRK
jgi:glycerol-3-phosphate acyltransferase PlsY